MWLFGNIFMLNTVDSAFNELSYNEILEFLNIYFFKTDFFNRDITMKGDKILFFSGPLNFAKQEIYCISMEIADFVTIQTRYELAFLGSQSHMGKEVKAD